jgi:hypothetical protein
MMMNPAIMKLLAQMGEKGKGIGEALGKGVNYAGAKGGQLAGMAARNPKTAAGIGIGGAGAAGLGMGMGEDEPAEDELEMIMELLRKGRGYADQGKEMLGM